MSQSSPKIDDLRREIDSLDDAIHDLLVKRVRVTERIAEAKQKTDGGRQFVRPGREAQILRRLLARHKGAMPRPVVARIWREMIAAVCRMHSRIKVAVCAPVKSVGYWDLARDHYGSATPMTLHHSPQIVLRMVSENDDVMGVLPVPGQNDDPPWWPYLATDVESAPRIIARLPFVADAGSRIEDLDALVVARIPPEPSGDDVSLLAVAADEEVSRDRLREILMSAGIDGHPIAIHSEGTEAAGWLHLVEVAGFVAGNDRRLAAVVDADPGTVRGVVSLGAYAAPSPTDQSAAPK